MDGASNVGIPRNLNLELSRANYIEGGCLSNRWKVPHQKAGIYQTTGNGNTIMRADRDHLPVHDSLYGVVNSRCGRSVV